MKRLPNDLIRVLQRPIESTTQSGYTPYPGFEAPHGAVGEYNGKFMINQLVLRGANCLTPPGHTRITYRNFFYLHQRWQAAGFRLAD